MDDLNDLVWTSPPTTTASLSSTSRTGSPFSSFDMLANTSNRSFASSPAPSFNSSSLKPTPAAPVPRPAASADAFASLLSLGGSSGKTSGPLSMAEKAAKLADEQSKTKEAEAKAFAGQGAFWDQFGGAGPASAASGSRGGGLAPPPSAVLHRISSPALVPSRPSSSASNTRTRFNSNPSHTLTPPHTSPSNVDDIWSEFDTLSTPLVRPSSTSASSSSRPPPPPPSQPANSAFDSFDMFEDLTVSAKPPPSQPSSSSRSTSKGERTPRTLTPGDHDFGSREDRVDDGWRGKDVGGLLAGGESDDDDDFMGAFSKPKPAAAQEPLSQTQTTSSSRRPVSPPPHILGQIVEMGFSLAQARNALASTPSGLNVQTALEMLISESQTSSTLPPDAGGNADSEEERSRREEEEAAERRRRRRRGPARDEPFSAAEGASGTSTPGGDGLSAAQLQEQASKLLASTNLLGQSMFNRANAFWKEGKTQVQKAYEERQKAAESTGGAGGVKAGDGRPKWMVDAEAFEAEERRAASSGGVGGGFKDGDDEEEPPRPSRTNGKQPSARTSVRQPARQQQPAASTSAAAKVASLFEDEPVAYVSPNRRRPAPSSSNPPGRVQQPPAISRSSPSAPPLRERNLGSAPESALEAAASHRTKGNDLFKLGRFGDAELAYTSALSSLPPNHVRSIPLLNNRAAARLKNGDDSGSAADSTAVINLVGLEYHPSKEAPLPADLADLQLGDALVKALSKRASAYEAGEKWEKAREDWDLIGKLEDGVGGKAAKIAAMDGARRCRKMTDVMNGKRATPPPPPKPKPAAANTRRTPPSSSKHPAPSEGLARLQASNAAQESEDFLRSQLKDSVEARLQAWKQNKETNLRALLASLDMVLWPELGWQKVGLHELVMDKQVKIKYTRAIAKVHPDKLNALGTSATVEQRMIAGGVFGVLNEAWNASQS